MTRYHIAHKTIYTYTQAVTLCHNDAHLKPRSFSHQRCHESAIAIDPSPKTVADRLDYFGNVATSFSIDIPHKRLEVIATSDVETRWPSASAIVDDSTWEQIRDDVRRSTDADVIEARSYLLPSPYLPILDVTRAFAHATATPGMNGLETVRQLMNRVYTEFVFDPESTNLATPLADVFARKRGVCQDFAHAAIASLRALGIPAGYVSGYLETMAPEGQERLVGVDASHAWVRVFIPSLGWIDFDPTNNQLPVAHHVVLAWGRDYGDVTPLKGVVIGGSQHALEVSVDVARVQDQVTS